MANFWETTESQSLKDTIFQYLENIGCCIRCILRLMGENNFETFLMKENVLKKFESYNIEKDVQDVVKNEFDEPVLKKAHTSPCICCLGLLQFGVSEKVVDQILSSLKLSGHQFKRFVLRLTVPPTIELREHLVLNHLEEKFSSVYTSSAKSSLASVRDVFKWSYGPVIGRTFVADFDPFSDFAISVFFSQENYEKEIEPLEQLSPNAFPNRNRKSMNTQERYSRSAVLKALNNISWSKLKEQYLIPPEAPAVGVEFDECIFQRDPTYLAGRYNKYSRNISQTPWFIEGEKKFKNSVEEIIVEGVKKHIVVDKIVFRSSGREDVDVRMLGKGRPFVLELIDVKKPSLSQEECKTIQNEINSSTKDVVVSDIQNIKKSDVFRLKEGEEHKKKLYSGLCCLKKIMTEKDVETLAELSDLVIQQKTPIRVLHRRNLAVRPKTVYSTSAEIIDDHKFKLLIRAQAGTYIKEFVHGDFGRTIPNIGTILQTEADMLELDVEEIEIDWPPKVD